MKSPIILFITILFVCSSSQTNLKLIELKKHIDYSYKDKPHTRHHAIEGLPFKFEYVRPYDKPEECYFTINDLNKKSLVALSVESIRVYKVIPQTNTFNGEIIGVVGWDDGSGTAYHYYLFFIDKKGRLIKYAYKKIPEAAKEEDVFKKLME